MTRPAPDRTGDRLPPTGGFEAVWRHAEPIPGWLTEAQARMLYDEVARLPPGARVVEIGSHQGRSTVVLAGALAGGPGAPTTRSGEPAEAGEVGEVVAVDPFVEGRLFGGIPTRVKLLRHLEEAGVRPAVRLVEEYSTRLRPRWTEPVDLVYVDGKHDYWTLSDDLRWAAFLPPGGTLLVHDCFSSIGVTLGVLAHVLPSRQLTYVRRAGSLALFRVQPPTLADRWRIVCELPWWLRNVGLKVLLRLRLRRVAAWFGHTSPYDPY